MASGRKGFKPAETSLQCQGKRTSRWEDIGDIKTLGEKIGKRKKGGKIRKLRELNSSKGVSEKKATRETLRNQGT